nr:RNA-dependent RNA polymerase [Flumine picornavirus 12]
MAWLIIKKKYFWWLYEYAKTHMTDIRLGIGFNMFGSDVTRLYRHLLSKGPSNCSDGDVKEWDGKFGPDVWDDTSEIARRCASVIILKVDKETLRRIKLIGMSAKYRIHICEDMIYVVIWGMPSGDFLTALFNSIGHLQKDVCIWNIFWLGQSEKGEKSYSSDDWIELTYCCKMGDDDINSITDEIKELYTPEARQAIWIALDYEYTDATKTGQMRYKDIYEVSFLKCTFQKTEHQGFVKMGIDQEFVIQELTNWVRTGQDEFDALVSNLEDSLRFSHAYGTETFESYKQQFNNELRKLQRPALTLNYDELEREWLEANGIGIYNKN